jgi:hypothetical protein
MKTVTAAVNCTIAGLYVTENDALKCQEDVGFLKNVVYGQTLADKLVLDPDAYNRALKHFEMQPSLPGF